MATIDPESCQLVEVPIDANGAIVVQDPSGLIASGQVQSVLDPRVSQSGQRGGRTPARKPLVPAQSLQMIQSAQVIPQSAVIAPTASGLLSLGTRYTPSSGIPLTTGQGGGIITSQGNIFSSSGSTMVTNAGSSIDRDGGYRFATVGNAGNRGRPRGRRPLRGQFPVVPIDMVRQLGIEQQVILQPAAPVAMKNKAVLCRPLSVSRKTQAGINFHDVECQFSADEEALDSKHDEDVEEDGMMVVEERPLPLSSVPIIKKDGMEDDTDLIGDVEDEEGLSDSEMEQKKKKPPPSKCIEIGANTEALLTNHLGTQTEYEVKKTAPVEEVKTVIKYVPIPIPVPIYVPVPVCTYAQPVPFVLPLPLPCPIPLPLLLPSDKATDDKAPQVKHEEQKEKKANELEAASKHIVASHCESEAAIIGSRPQKRSTKEMSSPSSTAEQVHPSKRSRRGSEAVSSQSSTSTLTPASRRAPISDATYHLKFSYGINAWRHWITQNAQPKALVDVVEIPDEELNVALSRFVREVRKPNNETYVADSIFYLCLGIQEFLNEHGRTVNIFGDKFETFTEALDTILSDFRPRISPEGMLICRIEEEHMWEAKQLGDHNPHVLVFTVLYFITKHMWLRTGDQHAQLCFSNFKLKRENAESECVLFVPGGGSESYRMFATAEPSTRCPVRLFLAYLKKCPQALTSGSGPFYLAPQHSESSTSTWYSENTIPAAQLQIMLNRIKMVKEIQEAFMDSPSD
nr:Zinc finger MYM type protein 3 [Hymenolepis microstoma]